MVVFQCARVEVFHGVVQKGGRGWIGASTTGWPKESRRLSISMRGSAARSIVGGIVGEECPRCRGSVQAEAAFAVRRHESKSNVITFESEHPPRISNLRRFFEASGRSSCSSSDFNSPPFHQKLFPSLYFSNYYAFLRASFP